MSDMEQKYPFRIIPRVVKVQGFCAYPIFPCLCLAAVLFPFSVAACNIALGLALGLAFLSGILWQGICIFSVKFPALGLCFIIYFLFLVGGLFWSIDFHWGVHVLGRQWYWLLLPVLVVSLAEPKKRNYFLWAISVGLTANLVFCMLQMFEYVSVTTVAGSNANDPTGHIGHIGFGVIYGTWAGLLLHTGLKSDGIKRWLACAGASWAYFMVFTTQGRSGYIVALLLLIIVLFQWYRGISFLRPFVFVCGVLLLTASMLFVGMGKDRISGAWLAVSGMEQTGIDKNLEPSVKTVEFRFYMWKVALSIWQDHQTIGVGTGGFPAAVRAVYEAGNLDLKAFNGYPQKILMAHPHNQYLLDLVRWGPLGLLSLCVLLFFWIKEGWSGSWRSSSSSGLVLISLSGLSLAVSGLFEPAMEEHFSAIFAVLLFGTGLAQSHDMIRN